MSFRSLAVSIFVILCVVALAWFFLPNGKQDGQQVLKQSTEKKARVKVDEPPKLQQNQSESVPLTKEEVLKAIEKIPKANAMYKAGIRSNLKFGFYGRVIDQYEAPVEGAEVEVSLLKWRILDAGGEYHSFTTDADGIFEIDGLSAQRITFEDIKREGYEINGWESFRAAYIPKTSRQNPYVFHAWKKAESESLYYGEYKQKLRSRGVFEAINIPELGNSFSAKFDLDPKGIPYRPENWKISLKINGGGLIESNNEAFMNLAPESGYQSVWSKSYVKGEQGFTDEETKKFYFRSGNNFGRMEINYVAYYKEGVAGILRIKYWLNPNGSRNLQYDPSKRIR